MPEFADRHGVMRCVRSIWRLGALAGTFMMLATTACAADPWRWSDVDRVVVLPDIHGAYPAMLRLLKQTNVIDDALGWSGGKTHLVSLGDLLDRGSESRAVMDLLMRLQSEASIAGGRVHVVAGNHELMNLIGDLRYVSRQEFAEFADSEPEGDRERALERFVYTREFEFDDEEKLHTEFSKIFPPGYFGHRAAFGANGVYGQWLLSLPAVISINDMVFVHGGLPPIVAERSLDELNREYRTSVSSYLDKWRRLIELGILPDDSSEDAAELAQAAAANADPSACVQERLLSCEQTLDVADDGTATWDPAVLSLLNEFVELSGATILGPDGPLWYRGAVYCPQILERPILDAALANLGASKVVVGHTTTADNRSHLIHDRQLLMLDTGMLVSYYAGRPAALIIENDETVVQYLDPDERLAPVVEGRYLAYKLSHEDLDAALENGSVDVISKDNETLWQVELSFADRKIIADFYPGGRGKPDSKELAASSLDKLIGLNLVPITRSREIDGTVGALQLRYPDGVSEAERQARGLGFAGWCSIQDQLQLMYAWDILLANAGRNYENLKFRQGLWTLHLTDHGMAFSTNKRLPKGVSAGAITLAPGTRSALAALDEQGLHNALGDYLSKREIRALLSRRDRMLELF